MVIELLEVACPPELRAAFVQRDAEIWTAALAQQPGFIAKEVWTSDDDPERLVLVIRWETMAHWKAFPADLAHELDRKMGDLLMPLRCQAYELQRSTDPGATA